jgi:hypothetical protein
MLYGSMDPNERFRARRDQTRRRKRRRRAALLGVPLLGVVALLLRHLAPESSVADIPL